MQHATERVERPGESQEALDGKKGRPGSWPVVKLVWGYVRVT